MFSATQQRSGTFADIARQKSQENKDSIVRFNARRKARSHEDFTAANADKMSSMVEQRPQRKVESVGDSIVNALEDIANADHVETKFLEPVEILDAVLLAMVDDASIKNSLKIIFNAAKSASHACDTSKISLRRVLTTAKSSNIRISDPNASALFGLLLSMAEKNNL
jgi:hypothetical protein